MSSGATSEQARTLDASSEELGVPTAMLMALASFQVARLASAVLGQQQLPSAKVAVLAGAGNNGADALGAARHLSSWGHPVRCLVLGDLESPGTTYRQQASGARAGGAELTSPGPGALEWVLQGCALILDGLLGTGARGAPRAEIEAIIDAGNRNPVQILAIDLPSGLDASLGTAAGACIRATHTLMLGVAKTGCLQPGASPYTGELWLADIGIPSEAYRRAQLAPPHLTGELQRLPPIGPATA